MRIGINAHLLSFSENYRQAGLSRYIEELLFEIPPIMPRARFTGFVGSSAIPSSFLTRAPINLQFKRSALPTERAPLRIAWEQTALPWHSAARHLDLLHCPVNIVPALGLCPAVVTIHDLIFLRTPENFHAAKRFYLAALTGWSARHSARVICVSDATRRDVIELLHVRPTAAVTVHNGVGTQFVEISEERRAAFRGEKGIEGRIVLFVGTLEPRKNLPVLLHAFSQLATQPDLSDVRLLIGGSKGWYYSEIFAAAERLGLAASGRVQFLGRVPDAELPLWYNIATVFAYPSVYEGFGLPALEAMSCGAPVVVSNSSAFPEVVGSAGILVDPSDVSGWATALTALLRDTALRERLCELGTKQAGNFSWARAARETVVVYKKALGLQQERAHHAG